MVGSGCGCKIFVFFNISTHRRMQYSLRREDAIDLVVITRQTLTTSLGQLDGATSIERQIKLQVVAEHDSSKKALHAVVVLHKN